MTAQKHIHIQTADNTVSLEEMLAARDYRAGRQRELIGSYGTPVVSFTLNIPGPVKVFDGVPEAFERGVTAIGHALAACDIPILHREQIREKTGHEAFYCADAAPELLKQEMTRLEEDGILGRLFDIDVIRTDGEKVSRSDLGLPVRTCLLCGEPAHVCSRSRRHSVAELTEKIREILADAGCTADHGCVDDAPAAPAASVSGMEGCPAGHGKESDS